jgi:prepilin-type N-terminal cleavage/methylation domain-containing protein
MLKDIIRKNIFTQQVSFGSNLFLKSRGFTILELLIVILIIGLLAVLVSVSYRSSEKKYALNQSVQLLVSNLRKVQTMAMSGVDIQGQYCGYGVKINTSAWFTSYRIYADKSANCQNSNHKYDSSDDILETVNLPNRIIIQATSPSPIDIFFKPPKPTTYINQDAGVGVTGTITLQIEGTSLNKTVTVTTAGLIQNN